MLRKSNGAINNGGFGVKPSIGGTLIALYGYQIARVPSASAIWLEPEGALNRPQRKQKKNGNVVVAVDVLEFLNNFYCSCFCSPNCFVCQLFCIPSWLISALVVG